MVAPITAASITRVEALENNPVFFLFLNNAPRPQVVVKGENINVSEPDTRASIDWASKIMKNVNIPQARMKLLSQTEVAEFMTAANRNLAHFSLKAKNSLQRKLSWVKMEYIDGLVTANNIFEKGESLANEKLVAETFQRFRNHNVWLELGKVVAADIFNGNGDRFDLVKAEVQNLNNMVFLRGGTTNPLGFESLSVVGLDSFDPNAVITGAGNLNLSDPHMLPDVLFVLVDREKRWAFAERCVKDLPAELLRLLPGAKSKRTDAGRFVRLPKELSLGRDLLESIYVWNSDDLFERLKPYVGTFERGIAQGAAALQQYLTQKVRKYAMRGGPSYGDVQSPSRGLPPPPRLLPAPPPPLGSPLFTQSVLGGWRMPGPLTPLLPPLPGRKSIPPGVLARMDKLGWL